MKVREQREDLLRRLPIFRLAVMMVLVTIAGSYWFVQGVQGSYYRELAENNRFRRLPIRAPRGLVFDREGRLLVENVPSYELLLDRSRTRDVGASLAFAAQQIGRDREELEAALRQVGRAPDFKPVLVAEGLSLTDVARLSARSLEHPEFQIEVGHQRLYRYGPHFAHVLGHLGEVSAEELGRPGAPYRAGDLVGKRGVEQAFDNLLRGQDGERVVEVDSQGRVEEVYGKVDARAGRSLQLTLDLELQQVAARYFEDKVGAVVALDPANGEILALLSSPSYSPNLFSHRLDRRQWQDLVSAPHQPLQNRALQNVYSPGSVFKIVMAVAGLSAGVIDEHDRVFCGGSATIYKRRFRCWKREGHGWVDLHEAIKNSCDVYFYHLGQKLGIDAVARYARLLDLGSPTGIDIPGEKAGLVPDSQWSLADRGTPWYPGETISVAIGQGPLLVTPLQIAGLMASVANGGYRITPHLLRAGTLPPPQPLHLDPRALEAVRQGLWAVVTGGGTGAVARVPGLEVAGKTGTVQVVRQDTWIDSRALPFELRDHAWFASFASGGGRSLVVVVFVEHGGKGSQAAAPLAKQIFETYYASFLAGHGAS